jgi:hypothetical protein
MILVASACTTAVAAGALTTRLPFAAGTAPAYRARALVTGVSAAVAAAEPRAERRAPRRPLGREEMIFLRQPWRESAKGEGT